MLPFSSLEAEYFFLGFMANSKQHLKQLELLLFFFCHKNSLGAYSISTSTPSPAPYWDFLQILPWGVDYGS